MSFLTIPAGEVQVGDSLYLGDHYAKNPNMRWGYIYKVKRQATTITVVTSVTEQLFRHDEPVMIQRFENSC